MSTSTPPSPSTSTRPAAARAPLALQLAPYVISALLIAGVIVLLALDRISETAGVGLLGVVIGGHGAVAIGSITRAGG